MTLSPEKKRELRVLITMALEGDIAPSQSQHLGQLLSGDPEAMAFYFEFLEITKALKDTPWLSHAKERQNEDTDVFDARMWQALAELEKTAPPVPPKPIPEPQTPHTHEPHGPVANNILWPRVLGVAALICIGLFFVALFSPKPNEQVCRIQTLVNDVWATKAQAVQIGDWINTRDEPRQLISGMIKLVFDHEAEVLIEAPAVFSVQDVNHLMLERGRAYAIVPKSAHGFTILTPNSEVVDLGTEFGVHVDVKGTSNVQVYEGETTLKANSAPESSKISLTEGQAKQVNPLTQRISNSPFHDRAFVRYLASDGSFVWRGEPFDLADCVGQGNGFGTGRLNSGISLVTGHSGQFVGFGPVKSQPGFLETEDMPFIHGIFTPLGSEQTVSNTGLIFNTCPITSGFSWGGAILNGATHEDQSSALRQHHQYRLGSMEFGTLDRPAISMHANAGITFDLQAIQASIEGVELDQFKTWCGISETYFDYRSNASQSSMTQNEPFADFYVLLDGEIAFQALDVTPSQGAIDIDVAVHKEHQFLTLVVTEGQDNQIMGDWALFAAPRITLKRQSSDEK